MQQLKEGKVLRIPEDDYIDWLLKESDLVMQYRQALAVYPKKKKKSA